MKYVQANPARPIRIVNIAGCTWVLLTILASLVGPRTSSYVVALYIPLTLVLICLITWYTPHTIHYPWFRTNFRITLFFLAGLIFGMTTSLFVAGARYFTHWTMFLFQAVLVSGVYYFLSLPFYIITCGIFNRIRQFPKPYECRVCGYNLTGNVSGRCPECGTECANTIQGSVDQQEDRVENR